MNRTWLSIALALAFVNEVSAQQSPAPSVSRTVNVADYAKPDDDIDDVMGYGAALADSKPGDTIQFPAGTLKFSRPISFKSSRSYVGERAILKFALNKEQYGIWIDENSSNITVSGLTFDGGGVRLTDGKQYTNITFRNNTFTHMSDTPAVYCTVVNEKLVIEENTFRDFPQWGVILWQMNNGSYSHNKFFRINQGGQIMEPRENVQLSFNVGRKLHRMGLEIQQQTMTGPPCKNLTVEGNVFYDWDRPYWDSFGLSVMPQNSTKTTIKNNYILASHDGEWGEKDKSGRNRFGFGIEAGFRSGVIENNIVAGDFWHGIVVASKYAPVRNNKLHGIPKDNAVGGEPGANGWGNPVEDANEVNADLSRVPPPPTTLPSE